MQSDAVVADRAVGIPSYSLLTIGLYAGVISLVVGIPAMILGGYVSDRVSRRLRGGRMAFTSLAALASVPLWLALLFTDQLTVLVAVNVVLYALAILWRLSQNLGPMAPIWSAEAVASAFLFGSLTATGVRTSAA